MRIAIFLRHEFHKPILLPLAELLRERHEVLVGGGKWDLVDFNPHVFVAGESLRPFRFHYHLPFTLFVHTRHGLASKGVAVQSARFSHYTCVTSLAMERWYEKKGVRPRRGFWVTGYPQMDPLFAPDPPRMPRGVPESAKVVLYAPTYNHGLTSIRMLGERTIDLLAAGRDDVHVVVKPHPLIAKHHPDWLAWITRESARRDNVHLARDVDADLMPFLSRADLLVSDASSAMLEFLALDRPMVLITNPERAKETFFDPEGFEWAWRSMGAEVFDVADVPEAIRSNLDDPDLRRAERRNYRRILFGDLADGVCTRRVAERIDRLSHEVAGPWRMGASRRWGRLVRRFHRRQPLPAIPVAGAA